jgi:DNA-directed RNA polymerase specialized sigma24 family protein
LVARIWGGLTFDEIGTLCAISAATACRRYHAALAAVKTRLDTPCQNHL